VWENNKVTLILNLVKIMEASLQIIIEYAMLETVLKEV